MNAAFDKAKSWAGAVLILQAALFLAGIIAIFAPHFTISYPWIALPLALLGAGLTSHAARLKGMAETVKRQHEYVAGFGRVPSGRQLADLRMNLPEGLPAELDRLLREGITYSSAKPPGPVRVLENLSESAWFSKHLAAYCTRSLAAVFVITMVIAVSLLLLCATTLTGTSVGIAAAKCVSATLLFLISVGTVRSCFGYHRFAQKAAEIDTEACSLAANQTPDPCETQRLLAEYQLARASAPLIPTWVWRFRRKRLNQNWALRAPSKE